MPWEGRGTMVITPEACVTVCLAVLEVIPDKGPTSSLPNTRL